jgi:O-antigen ligase
MISLFWSQVYRDPLVQSFGSAFVAVATAAVMVLLPATFFLAANLIKHERWIRTMVWVFLGAGLVSLVVSLVIDMGIGPTQALRGLVFYNGLVWINTQGPFSLWYIAFALSLTLFNKKLNRYGVAALLLFVAGWVYWGFFLRSNWLSGWVPAFATIGLIIVLRSKKMIPVILVVLLIVGQFYMRTAFEQESAESGDTRLAAYEVNWRITGKHVIFGTGPAGYTAYYMTYFPLDGMASHSNYIDIIAQTGVLGTFFILWFFGVQLWGGYKLRRKLQGRGDFAESLAVAILAGTVACMTAMALGDWLFPFTYTQGLIGFDSAMFHWFFMGLLWALRHVLEAETSPGSSEVKA